MKENRFRIVFFHKNNRIRNVVYVTTVCAATCINKLQVVDRNSSTKLLNVTM